jgi:hypothetical protein
LDAVEDLRRHALVLNDLKDFVRDLPPLKVSVAVAYGIGSSLLLYK